MDLSGSVSMDSSSRNVPDQPGTSAGGGCSDALSTTRQPSLISSLWSIQVQHEGSNSDFPMDSPKGSLPEIVQASSCCHFQPTTTTTHGGGCAAQQIGAGAGGGGGICADQQQLVAGASADHHHPLLATFPHHHHHQQQQSAASSAGVGPADGACAAFQTPPSPYANNPSPLRPVKSLSDLSSLVAGGGGGQICASHPFGGQICPFAPNVTGNNGQYATMNNSNRRLTETGILYGGGGLISKQQRDSQICDWLQTAMLAMRVGEGGGDGTSGSESPPEMGGCCTQFGQQQRPSAAHNGAEQQQ